MNIGEAQKWGRGQLLEARDADYLLCGVLNANRTILYSHADKALTSEQLSAYKDAIQRRSVGEPVAYILGEKEFWSLPLSVSSATLIPRPETELLVENVLKYLTKESAKVCDLGTGTGAVALALAHERPAWQILGVDRVEDAVALAKTNAQKLAIENATFLQSNWFSALGGHTFDAIVSNPPYVEKHSSLLQQGDVRFEPDSALCAGTDGLDDIRHIAQRAPNYLNDGGWLLLEHGFDQQVAIIELLKSLEYVDITAIQDLNRIDRVVIARSVDPQIATRG